MTTLLLVLLMAIISKILKRARKIGSLLASLKPIVPQELKETYEKCIPKFKMSICDTFLPRCNGKYPTIENVRIRTSKGAK